MPRWWLVPGLRLSQVFAVDEGAEEGEEFGEFHFFDVWGVRLAFEALFHGVAEEVEVEHFFGILGGGFEQIGDAVRFLEGAELADF